MPITIPDAASTDNLVVKYDIHIKKILFGLPIISILFIISKVLLNYVGRGMSPLLILF